MQPRPSSLTTQLGGLTRPSSGSVVPAPPERCRLRCREWGEESRPASPAPQSGARESGHSALAAGPRSEARGRGRHRTAGPASPAPAPLAVCTLRPAGRRARPPVRAGARGSDRSPAPGGRKRALQVGIPRASGLGPRGAGTPRQRGRPSTAGARVPARVPAPSERLRRGAQAGQEAGRAGLKGVWAEC